MKHSVLSALTIAGCLSIGAPSQAQVLRIDPGFSRDTPATQVQFRGGHGGFHGGGFHGGGFHNRGFGGRGFYGRGYGGRGYYGRGYGGYGYGLGGLAAGALIGSAIASAPYYYDRSYYVDEPQTIYEGGGNADYCARRFKSYDPASGTYLGYDGRRHPCG
ncbi:MAG: BA14K family protein [Beijerinckiaceae bacterium]|nr:BA14K family protein [Beijerinckiaceae bacterium]